MVYVVFDERYNYNPDRAVILFATDDENEAEEYATENNGVVQKLD